MALLKLKDVGKIYASEGSVAVGIRGVNLSFDRGEFVAITGKSGSGKSTLLNVISGMDSYEEGELYVEGQSTSHYLQPEWEEYRSKYISFIFQDYNIIESFTVLQNVELALMNIEDPKQRRAKAMELIGRVGLTSHVKHKGSKLSGGQKQRTVIARALAKDSPIILADEPTGNLDSQTSREIIELLKEVSKDKLLIVVTHNFDQVEAHATRHIRIFDGAVEFDHVISRPAHSEQEISATGEARPTSKKETKKQRRHDVRNGFSLGKAIFRAKPFLSTFICFLMIIGMLGLFLVTSLCGNSLTSLFEPTYMFTNMEGRLVLTKRSGAVITDEELQALALQHGATGTLHYDQLLDQGYAGSFQHYDFASDRYRYESFKMFYGKDYGEEIIGSYPQADDEAFLYLPISYRPTFGTDPSAFPSFYYLSVPYRICGVKYYYDNNQPAECLLTEKGFRTATAIYYLIGSSSPQIEVEITDVGGNAQKTVHFSGFTPSFELPKGQIYLSSPTYNAALSGMRAPKTEITVTSTYFNYDYYSSYNDTDQYYFTHVFTNENITKTKPNIQRPYEDMYYSEDVIVISSETVREMAEDVLEQSYRQATLFFEDDKAAHAVAVLLNEGDYLAVPSDTTYEPEAFETILKIVGAIGSVIFWALSIVFLAFFVNLCSSRALNAFKGDMAIMRSMGISVKVIRIGMYVRMLISLIPACILLCICAIMIFTVPITNQFFTYLYAWQYALIIVGMLLLTVRITHKQIRKLFKESVKKSLRGGNAE